MSALRTVTTSRIAFIRPTISALPIIRRRNHIHQDQGPNSKNSDDAADMIDALANGEAKGRTGGGKPLDASKNAPAKPKITNQSVPGWDSSGSLTEEQRREVDEHNRDFDAKHDHGHQAPGDKVDKKFWGEQRREFNEHKRDLNAKQEPDDKVDKKFWSEDRRQ
ncbi:hypothetical protein B0T10DRAFT_229883 [Thelonectria olida]|uniref:Uncharacterized protein n=1 Tax=Thelonectria olida TaxID=1576542 RepID=A0A9P8WDK7_9HYPO|nr:hypothetical protein B0T10DRAFT_229883 [Thelonectria olida]